MGIVNNFASDKKEKKTEGKNGLKKPTQILEDLGANQRQRTEDSEGRKTTRNSRR